MPDIFFILAAPRSFLIWLGSTQSFLGSAFPLSLEFLQGMLQVPDAALLLQAPCGCITMPACPVLPTKTSS